MRGEHVFCITNFIKIVLARQKQKNSDTFVIIYGSRRTGKTNLGFKILTAYLKAKRAQYKKDQSDWDVPVRWKHLFEKYFAANAGDMSTKIKDSEDESFCFVDEGDDVLSWHEMFDEEQKSLTRLILKSGKKKIFTILIVPSLKLLQKNILACAHYFFILTGEPRDDKNTAFVFRNYDNPILRENNPFNLNKIVAQAVKNKSLRDRDQFEAYLQRQDRFLSTLNFVEIPADLYRLYDKLVKDPQIVAVKGKKRSVPIATFEKQKYCFDTILYNLKMEGSSITRISHLVRDKYGRQTMSATAINARIDALCAMTTIPTTIEEEEKQKEKEKKEAELELNDIIGLSFEK